MPFLPADQPKAKPAAEDTACGCVHAPGANKACVGGDGGDLQ